MKNTTLIELIINYQKESKDINFYKIIYKLTPLINQYLSNIPESYQSDIKQEIYLKTLYTVQKSYIKLKYIEKEKFNKTNLKKLLDNNLNKNTFKEIFCSEYIYTFAKKYGKDKFLKVFDSKELLDEFVNSFALYNANNQIYYLLKLKFQSVIDDFFRKDTHNINSLLLKEAYLKTTYQESKKYLWDYLENKDMQFLKNFIDGKKLLTQKEVAKKLNISQQAVSKKIQKLKKKYKNKLKL